MLWVSVYGEVAPGGPDAGPQSSGQVEVEDKIRVVVAYSGLFPPPPPAPPLPRPPLPRHLFSSPRRRRAGQCSGPRRRRGRWLDGPGRRGLGNGLRDGLTDPDDVKLRLYLNDQRQTGH